MITDEEDIDKANLVLTLDNQRGLQALFEYSIYLGVQVTNVRVEESLLTLRNLVSAQWSPSLFLPIDSYPYGFRFGNDGHLSARSVQTSNHSLVGHHPSFHSEQSRSDEECRSMSTDRFLSDRCLGSVQPRERPSSTVWSTIRRRDLHVLVTLQSALSFSKSRR